MLGKYLQFMYFVFLCSTHLCSGDKNTSVVYAVKNCVLSENASFLHGIVGHLFSDESDEKADYYFSVCGFKTEENSSVSLNQSIIAVSEASVVELGSFTNFTISNKGDRHLVRFNDSEIITDLILGCGSMAAFHLISHENDKSYSFDLFHPSLCSAQQSTKYTFTVILVCCLAFIVGYCVLSSLIKRYLYGRPWHQSVPFTDTFEHLKNRFQFHLVAYYLLSTLCLKTSTGNLHLTCAYSFLIPIGSIVPFQRKLSYKYLNPSYSVLKLETLLLILCHIA
ncbi:unnamed protein product [Schistosoma intercalatum]|nr:unnamed protein product [Schistosoma intercalatum]CAH8431914.1 unnamed protein product [Schistosoma intercalatum]